VSIPEKKLNQILNELNENDVNKVLNFAESLKKHKNKRLKPSDFRGIWKNKKLDTEKMCQELRDEWDRNIL